MRFLGWFISVELEVFQGAHKYLNSVKIWFTGFNTFGFEEFFCHLTPFTHI